MKFAHFFVQGRASAPFEANLVASVWNGKSVTYKEALECEDSELFESAILDEYILIKNNNWEVSVVSQGKKLLSCKW